MKKFTLTIILLFLVGLQLEIAGLSAQSLHYGFTQDAENPLAITAVAIPDFSSDNVTISTAVFSFTISSSIVIAPAIDPVPAGGALTDVTGSWMAQKITPQVYSGAGLNGGALQGNDVYQVVLQNSPEVASVVAGQAIPLFSFSLVEDCIEGNIAILANDGHFKSLIYNDLRANFNNQMSLSIDDAPSKDIYGENDPFSALIECPLLLVSTEDYERVEPSLAIQPNPVTDYAKIVMRSNIAGNGTLVLYDVQQREILRQPKMIQLGTNFFELDTERLASATYLLVIQVDDLILKTKLIKTAR